MSIYKAANLLINAKGKVYEGVSWHKVYGGRGWGQSVMNQIIPLHTHMHKHTHTKHAHTDTHIYIHACTHLL